MWHTFKICFCSLAKKNKWFEFREYGEIVEIGSGFYFRRLKKTAMKGIKMPGMCEWNAGI
jgi:hypothetical protein